MAVGSNGFSAGNLEFQIQAMEKNTTATFSKLNSSLMTMMNLLGHTNSSFKAIASTAKSMSRMTFNWTEKLAKGLTSINNLDTQTFYNKMSSLTRIMQPFVSQLNQAQVSLVALQKVLSSGKTNISIGTGGDAGKSISNIKENVENIDKNLSKANSLSLAKILNKVYFIRNYTKQMFRSIGDMLGLAVDYTETLNLWQVVMRENREQADEFVQTMNKAYGLSTQTLMNYQAIFKNMLSSLGGLSEVTSYALSEYLTQMAIDYASLYNTSIEKAMTTFQSVLSGQVRPIRSIAGYDITETTIYQLYQQLGGTKTMRQLTQTEKRLLRIYAVFQQMESSGAVGDLNRTLNNTANQMRVLSESAKELKTWFGLLLEDILKPILPYLSAFVITLTNVVKAIAQMRDIKLFESGVVENVQELNNALDETSGKLLSFDKFEALNAGEKESNILGIDENLLSGLSQYSSILSEVKGEAQELAKAWTSWWVDANTGELTEQAQNLLNILNSIAITLGSLLALGLIKKVGKFIGSIMGVNTAMGLLNTTILSGVVFAIIKAIDAFEKGDIAGGVLATLIGVTLVGALILLELRKKAVAKATMYEAMAQKSQNASLKEYNLMMQTANKTISTKLLGTVGALSIGVMSAVGAFGLLDSLLGSLNGTAKTVVSALSIVVGALGTVLGLILAIKGGLKGGLIGASIAGLGVGALIAGIKGVASSNSELQVRKTGGMVEDGLFTMNKGEIMGTFDDGTSIVANNQQIISGIQQGVFSAVVSAMKQSGGNGVGNVYIDGRKAGQVIARPSHKEMIRTGLVRVTR